MRNVKFLLENPKGRLYLKDIDTEGRIIIKKDFKWDGSVNLI
jgi:hypothetical protein